MVFLIKIKLLKIGAFINSGPVLPQRARPRSQPSPPNPHEVGVVISEIKYGFQWAAYCGQKNCFCGCRTMKPNCWVKFVSARGEGGSAMGDFLTGASWGARFLLAAIIATGLWAFVY